MFQAASETSACVRMSPTDPDMRVTPFEVKHGRPAYQWYRENPEKGARFALAMAGVTQSRLNAMWTSFWIWRIIDICLTVDRQISELRECFPWDSLKNRTVVDVGGGSGHVSIYLASVCCPLLDHSPRRPPSHVALSN